MFEVLNLLFGIIEGHETNELCGQEANLKEVIFEKCFYFVVVVHGYMNFVQMQSNLEAEAKLVQEKTIGIYHKIDQLP
jgi:hypothetical protein